MFTHPFEEARVVPFQTRTVNNPNQVFIKPFPRSAFDWLNVRMLKLDHDPMLSKNIGNVYLIPERIMMLNLLPFARKSILPTAMPLCF
jgi:hypothetical protein